MICSTLLDIFYVKVLPDSHIKKKMFLSMSIEISLFIYLHTCTNNTVKNYL